MGSRVRYCTREDVMDAFDTKEASHRSAQVDAAIASASDDVDGWLNRHKHGLAPTDATRYFSWPSRNYSQSWRLWLDENEAVEITSITAGGEAITDYFLEPVNSGPPFTYIEVDLNSTQAFTNSGTSQRAIQVIGTWGINNDQDPAGTLAGAVNGSVTTWNVSDASLVGVGHVLTVDSERVLVTDKAPLDTTVDLAADLDALNSDQSITVPDGTAFHVNEILLVGSERMRIVTIAGNDLTVIRAYDGSTLASHLTGADIYAFRALTVERGALGTAAASHALSAEVTKWHVPDLVKDLTKAAAIVRLEQEFSAYAARVYSDEAERDSSGTEVVAGRGLTDLRRACARRYKRKFRKAAI